MLKHQFPLVLEKKAPVSGPPCPRSRYWREIEFPWRVYCLLIRKLIQLAEIIHISRGKMNVREINFLLALPHFKFRYETSFDVWHAFGSEIWRLGWAWGITGGALDISNPKGGLKLNVAYSTVHPFNELLIHILKHPDSAGFPFPCGAFHGTHYLLYVNR